MSAATAETSSPFPFLHEITDCPERREIVAGLFAAGELLALSGHPGTGKSALAVHLTECVAAGTPFLGRPVEASEVLYVAAEKRLALLRRLKAVAAGRRLPIRFASSAPRLDDEESVKTMIEALRKVGARPRLIIIDTLAACMGSLDENSARDVGKAVNALDAFSRAFPDAAVMILHHLARGAEGKNTNMRGSTALLGAVDLELRIEGTAVQTLKIKKANNIAEDVSFNFKLEKLPGEIITAQPAELSEKPQSPLTLGHQKILEMLPPYRVQRRSVLAQCRALGLLGNGAPDTQAEALRVALVALKSAGLVEYDQTMVHRKGENTPPCAPPENPLPQGGGTSPQSPPENASPFKGGIHRGGGVRAKKRPAAAKGAQGGQADV